MPERQLFAPRRSFAPFHWAIVATVLIGAVGLAILVRMDEGDAPVGTPSVTATLPVAPMTGPKWQDLTATQRQVLMPLEGTWDTLNSGHKGKWVALTVNYGTRSPDEQKKMQSRMLEWAALTPGQREQARLNFAETKKVSPAVRAADWETYQGLSDEEKRELAAKSKTKPGGAAVAVTPVPPSKLTAVPITRHTVAQESTLAAIKPRIDANTLLPVPAPAPTPVVIPAPAPPTPNPSSSLVTSDTLSPN